MLVKFSVLTHEYFFCSEFLFVQAPRVTRGGRLQNIRHNLCGYVWKITINPRFELTKVVVVGKTSSWESVSAEHWFAVRSCSSGTYFS